MHEDLIRRLRGFANVRGYALMAEAADALEAMHCANLPSTRTALSKINDWACYATEEDAYARETALLEIGKLARAALAEPDKPCATCEALARAVMMDQTGRDA